MSLKNKGRIGDWSVTRHRQGDRQEPRRRRCERRRQLPHGALFVRSIVECGGSAVAAGADVSDPAQLHGLFDLAEKEFGGLDIVVLNAANMSHGTFVDTTDEQFDAVFSTNARSSFVALREAALRLRPEGRAGSRLTRRRALMTTFSRALTRSATEWTPRITALNALSGWASSPPLGFSDGKHALRSIEPYPFDELVLACYRGSGVLAGWSHVVPVVCLHREPIGSLSGNLGAPQPTTTQVELVNVVGDDAS